MKRHFRSKTFVLAVGCLLLASIPFRTTTVPERRVRFLDLKGMPLVSLPVEQVWQADSIEPTESHARTHTDSNGYAFFPQRTVWASAILRLAYATAFHLGGSGNRNLSVLSSSIKPACDVLEAQENLTSFVGSNPPERVVLRYFDMSRVRNALREEQPMPPECPAIESQLRNADA